MDAAFSCISSFSLSLGAVEGIAVTHLPKGSILGSFLVYPVTDVRSISQMEHYSIRFAHDDSKYFCNDLFSCNYQVVSFRNLSLWTILVIAGLDCTFDLNSSLIGHQHPEVGGSPEAMGCLRSKNHWGWGLSKPLWLRLFLPKTPTL